MKKKIVEVLNNMGMGGAESLVKDYAQHIDKKNFELVVLVTGKRYSTPNEKKLDEIGVKTIYIGDFLPDVPKWDILHRFFRKRKRKALMLKYLTQESPNVIHGHQHVNEYIFEFVKRNSTKVGLIYTVHSVPKHIFRRKKEKRVTRKLIFKYKMKLIALQESASKELKTMFCTNDVIVLNNCIDVERFNNAKVFRNKYRQLFSIPEDAFVVGNVGRMNWIKNQIFLIDVFALLQKRRKNSFLIIVGAGEKRDAICLKIKELDLHESVVLLSNRSDVPEIMSMLDVFILPSFHEGFGLVAVEAQAVDVPCLLSDRIPKETYVSENVSVVSINDPPEVWCEAIYTSSFRVNKLNDLCEYDIKNCIKKLEGIYSDFCCASEIF